MGKEYQRPCRVPKSKTETNIQFKEKEEKEMSLDIQIEPYIELSWHAFERDAHPCMQDKKETFLHSVEIPRSMYDRWMWLFDWRTAKYKCRWPRKRITLYHHYFDKKSGMDLGYGTLLQKYISAKGQVTKVANNMIKYKEERKKTLFFDESTDELYLKLADKLKQKQANLAFAEEEMLRSVNQTQD